MSQHDMVLDDGPGASFRADINAGLQALATQQSGATEPATTYARQIWADTATNTLKQRNAANSGWVIVGTLDEIPVLTRSANTMFDTSDRDKTILYTGSHTQTFDAAANLGNGWVVWAVIEAGVTMMFDPSGAETIDGAATLVVEGPADCRIVCNGTLFRTVGRRATKRSGYSIAQSHDIWLTDSDVRIGEEGAKPGVLNDAAIQSVWDKASVYGRRIIVDSNGTGYPYTRINMSNCKTGSKFVGQSDSRGVDLMANGSCLYCVRTDAQHGIEIGSSFGVGFKDIILGYNQTAYTGNLVKVYKSGALDSGFISFERVLFTGEGAAIHANALLYMDETHSSEVSSCNFRFADRGFITGAGSSGVNALTLECNEFQALNVNNMLYDLNTNHTGLTLLSNIYEPLVNGKASALDATRVDLGFIFGFVDLGNWLGDVTTAGAGHWFRARFSGAVVTGGMRGTAGAGAGDYVYRVDNSFGFHIHGARFDAKVLQVKDSVGVVVGPANHIPAGSSAINVVSGAAPVIYGNAGISDDYGGLIRIGGGASPAVVFAPDPALSPFATSNAAISQNGDVLYIGESGVANRIQIGIKSGLVYLPTAGGALQSSSALGGGAGAPSPSEGVVGQWILAANRHIYYKSGPTTWDTIF